MATFTVALPDPLQKFLERKLADDGYRNESEYMQALLEAKRLEEAELEAWEGLREKVEEGLAAHPYQRPRSSGVTSGQSSPRADGHAFIPSHRK